MNPGGGGNFDNSITFNLLEKFNAMYVILKMSKKLSVEIKVAIESVAVHIFVGSLPSKSLDFQNDVNFLKIKPRCDLNIPE